MAAHVLSYGLVAACFFAVFALSVVCGGSGCASGSSSGACWS